MVQKGEKMIKEGKKEINKGEHTGQGRRATCKKRDILDEKRGNPL